MLTKLLAGVTSIIKNFKYAYPGSFDPWTRGHLSVITSFLDKDPEANIEVIIGNNPSKKALFSPEDRKFIIEQSIPEQYKHRIKVIILEDVVANYMYTQNIPYFIKGVRDAKDFEYENNLALLNSQLPGSPMTLLIPQTDTSLNIVSSSNLKLLANIGIRLERYAPAFVREGLKLTTTKKMFVGVTGGIASGKSTFCTELAEYAKTQETTMHHINMDKFGHQILTQTENVPPLFTGIRRQLADIFGRNIMQADGTINRKALGEIVFQDREKLDIMTNLLLEPILFLLAEEINSLSQGIIVVESAILMDRNLSELVDDNIVHVNVDQDVQIKRMLSARNYTQEQALRRIDSQLSLDQVRQKIRTAQEYDFDRLYMDVNSSTQFDIKQAYRKLEKEYLFRFNIRRNKDLFIPSELAFNDDNIFIKTITNAYNESTRSYHNIKHITDMLTEYQKIKHMLQNPEEVYLAIIFHDFIYDPQSKKNEEDSANYAVAFLRDNLKDTQGIDLELVGRLILLTAKHGTKELEEMELTEDEKLFLDIDMAILGSNPNRYAEYENGVKQEYRTIYSEEDYINGRKAFLSSLLGKPVYLSDHYRFKLQNHARQNIKSAIDSLSIYLQ